MVMSMAARLAAPYGGGGEYFVFTMMWWWGEGFLGDDGREDWTLLSSSSIHSRTQTISP